MIRKHFNDIRKGILTGMVRVIYLMKIIHINPHSHAYRRI